VTDFCAIPELLELFDSILGNGIAEKQGTKKNRKIFKRKCSSELMITSR
jgi:hypothetical protein